MNGQNINITPYIHAAPSQRTKDDACLGQCRVMAIYHEAGYQPPVADAASRRRALRIAGAGEDQIVQEFAHVQLGHPASFCSVRPGQDR